MSWLDVWSVPQGSNSVFSGRLEAQKPIPRPKGQNLLTTTLALPIPVTTVAITGA